MQNGEAPVQVMLSMNAYYIASQGVTLKLAIPKEGAVLGIDTMGIMKGSKNVDLAYKFINVVLDPAVQAEIATPKKGSPVVTNAKLDPEVAKLPGVFTTADQWNKEALLSTTSSAAKRPANGASGSPRTSSTDDGADLRSTQSGPFLRVASVASPCPRRSADDRRRPFLALFTAPAVLAAIVSAISMLAILQFSIRTQCRARSTSAASRSTISPRCCSRSTRRSFSDGLALLPDRLISLVLAYPLAYALVRSNNVA